MMRSIVPMGANKMTLARYIARAWPMLPGFAVREALKKRDARVNGVRADGGAPLHEGDEVTIYLPAKYVRAELETLYDDGRLIAFVKPRGLPVDVDADGVGEDTALARLRSIHAGARLVHRLDSGTGGVMLAALDGDMEALLSRAFRENGVHKRYAALAIGRFEAVEATLTAYLYKDASASKVRVSNERGGKQIITRYSALAEFEARGIRLTELAVEIPTGRTHQIRAHMAHIGHPLAGDDKYGDRAANRALAAREICLWCESLALAGTNGLEKYENMRFQKERPEWKITR